MSKFEAGSWLAFFLVSPVLGSWMHNHGVKPLQMLSRCLDYFRAFLIVVNEYRKEWPGHWRRRWEPALWRVRLER